MKINIKSNIGSKKEIKIKWKDKRIDYPQLIQASTTSVASVCLFLFLSFFPLCLAWEVRDIRNGMAWDQPEVAWHEKFETKEMTWQWFVIPRTNLKWHGMRGLKHKKWHSWYLIFLAPTWSDMAWEVWDIGFGMEWIWTSQDQPEVAWHEKIETKEIAWFEFDLTQD